MTAARRGLHLMPRSVPRGQPRATGEQQDGAQTRLSNLIRVTRSLHWRHLRHVHHFMAMAMALLATALYYLAFAKGTVLLLSSVAGMLIGAIPIFTFLMSQLFLCDERLNRRPVCGTLLGFAGVLLIARPWDGNAGPVSAAGVLWMIAGSLSVGCSFVCARKFITPLGLSPLALPEVLSRMWGEGEGGVTSGLFNGPEPALARRWRSRRGRE